jgi:hypothetical protein
MVFQGGILAFDGVVPLQMLSIDAFPPGAIGLIGEDDLKISSVDFVVGDGK